MAGDDWTPALRRPLGRVANGRVVGVGALCDLRPTCPGPPGSGSYSVSEFVRLEDGRRIALHEELGFTHSPPIGTGATSHSDTTETIERLNQRVLNTVLPDDDEEAAREAHPWEWLAALARARGITVTADALRRLDYEVVFSDALQRWIADP